MWEGLPLYTFKFGILSRYLFKDGGFLSSLNVFLFYLAIIASLYINANQKKTTRLLKESGQNSKGEFKMFDELECSSSELISLYDYDPMREYELQLESEIEITNEKLWPDEDEDDKPKKRRRSSGRRRTRTTKKAV